MKTKLTGTLPLLALALLSLPSLAAAADFFVDASAPTEGNGSAGSPWRSVQSVNNAVLPPGSRVLFRPSAQGYGSTFLVPKSGSGVGSEVTYMSSDPAVRPRLGGLNANGASYVKVVGLAFNSSSTTVSLINSHHVTVDNCDISSAASGWGPTVVIYQNSNNNRILNSRLTQNPSMNDILTLRGNANYNLIQGNTITVSGSHGAIGLEGYEDAAGLKGGSANYNIIRNNTLIGHNAAGTLMNMSANSHFNIIEGNVFRGDGTLTPYCGTNRSALHEVMLKVASQNNIVRRNILRDYVCQDSLGLTMEAYTYGGYTNISSGNHIYHNVITGVGPGATPLFIAENGTGGQCYGNYIKNNVVFNNGGKVYDPNDGGPLGQVTINTQMRVQPYGNVRDNHIRNNLFFKGVNGTSIPGVINLNDQALSVQQAQSASPLFSGNIQQDPLLDPATLRPLATSPVRDRGTNLTVATSSGSGTVLPVEDTWYFTDGLGLIDSDTIQVRGQLARIRSIDRNAKTLTLMTPISWSAGDGVNLPFSGSAPDLGVFELPASGGAAQPAAPGNVLVN